MKFGRKFLYIYNKSSYPCGVKLEGWIFPEPWPMEAEALEGVPQLGGSSGDTPIKEGNCKQQIFIMETKLFCCLHTVFISLFKNYLRLVVVKKIVSFEIKINMWTEAHITLYLLFLKLVLIEPHLISGKLRFVYNLYHNFILISTIHHFNLTSSFFGPLPATLM